MCIGVSNIGNYRQNYDYNFKQENKTQASNPIKTTVQANKSNSLDEYDNYMSFQGAIGQAQVNMDKNNFANKTSANNEKEDKHIIDTFVKYMEAAKNLLDVADATAEDCQAFADIAENIANIYEDSNLTMKEKADAILGFKEQVSEITDKYGN
ncbi:MAG: hypothetical protein IJD57_01595 [Candidatus Gastranaerophilales bacterium]|nr:hypothetical protein [Candidatus Gastranaerophilales bacterium]